MTQVYSCRPIRKTGKQNTSRPKADPGVFTDKERQRYIKKFFANPFGIFHDVIGNDFHHFSCLFAAPLTNGLVRGIISSMPHTSVWAFRLDSDCQWGMYQATLLARSAIQQRLHRWTICDIRGLRGGVRSTECRLFFLNFYCWTWRPIIEFSQFTGTRGHAYKLYKPRSDCTVRMNFFANRVINAWNNRPTSVSFTSLPAFSRSIRSVDFRNFLKCNSC